MKYHGDLLLLYSFMIIILKFVCLQTHPLKIIFLIIFIRLRVKSRDATLKEIDELQTFADANGFQHKLHLWDIPYWQRIQKEALFK